ncbi:ubiquitin domain-containing protein 1-like isoform X1 [Solanum pennellii]|uniref:Ubiquitin domain-containing protein 1-like isoform X1 n=1 Tax=Solanum pennellii TaxID=28526 RepID=A0ABM1V5K9_SOLPN|nr:ubiquitin domain-containing protein 1-like isoform X1 [Solanum pennellii]
MLFLELKVSQGRGKVCIRSTLLKPHLWDTRDAAKQIRKPKPWKHSEPITRAQLVQMRDEFWDTAPHYGGRKEIWDALRAAAESDISLAQAIVDSAGIIVQSPDLTICYDERGAKYELPKYVLSEPTNLIRDN